MIAGISRRVASLGLPLQSQTWALDYLRDQINEYRRGHLPLAMVASAAKIAGESNVPQAEILLLLFAAGVAYDADTHELTDIL
jgi:hypothetical protein